MSGAERAQSQQMYSRVTESKKELMEKRTSHKRSLSSQNERRESTLKTHTALINWKFQNFSRNYCMSEVIICLCRLGCMLLNFNTDAASLRLPTIKFYLGAVTEYCKIDEKWRN